MEMAEERRSAGGNNNIHYIYICSKYWNRKYPDQDNNSVKERKKGKKNREHVLHSGFICCGGGVFSIKTRGKFIIPHMLNEKQWNEMETGREGDKNT